jgi:enoyl-CoA hydratase
MPHVTITAADGGIAIVTLDRPPVNAMNVALIQDIVAAFEELHADPPAAVVLAGLEGVFSAGADLKEIPNSTPENQRAAVAGINAMVITVYSLTCPVVGAITGHAIAGGLVLALCTDFRIALASGSYGVTEIKVGVPYPQAALGVVRAEVAPHAARRLALGAELTTGQDCIELGAFDEVLETSDAVIARSLEIARTLAGMSADVYARTKRDLRAPVLEAMRAGAADEPLLERWL